MPPRVGKITMDNGNDNNDMHGAIEDLEQLELAVANAKWKIVSQCFCNAKHAVTISTSNPTTKYLSRKNKTCVYKETCM